MTSKPDPREQQRQRDQARVEAFVVRARRVQAHSLAQDPERLGRLARGETKVTLREGRTLVSYDYPPEEVVESAAARVRPLLLDDVSLLSTLKAITGLTADTTEREEVRLWATLIRRDWQRRVRKTDAHEDGFKAHYESTSTGETSSTDHVELALAWIYGDVVHHDIEHLERTRHWGVGERFRAAVPLVAFIISHALTVLESIRNMHERGMLEVAASAWECDVVADPNYVQEINLYVSEIGGGDPPLSAREPLGPEWTVVDSFTMAQMAADAHGEDQADAHGDQE